MGGASSVPLRKRHFSLEIASYRERQRWQASEGAPTRKPRTRKQVSLTLRIIKSVVEAFGEGESTPAMAPDGQGTRTARFCVSPTGCPPPHHPTCIQTRVHQGFSCILPNC